VTRRRALPAAGAAGVIVALALLVRLGWDPLADADRSADDQAHRLMRRHATALAWVRAVTHLGDPLVVTALVAVVALVCWLLHRRTDAVYLLAVRVVSVVLGAALKAGVARARPNLAQPLAHASGYSFPSGHALGAAATYLSLALVSSYRRPMGARLAVALAVVVALLVATTRVLLGVHFPSDVAAGLVLGWAIALVGRAALRRAGRFSSGR
jgi:undecaprenyl-diphosphatase